MSFDDLYTRWAPVNFDDPIDAFKGWLSCVFEGLSDYNIVSLDDLTDDIAFDITNGLFTAEELRFAIQANA